MRHGVVLARRGLLGGTSRTLNRSLGGHRSFSLRIIAISGDQRNRFLEVDELAGAADRSDVRLEDAEVAARHCLVIGNVEVVELFSDTLVIDLVVVS